MKKELQGWISVNDALPPAFNNVFVRSGMGLLNYAVVYSDGVWKHWNGLKPLDDTFKPTHWISKEDILNLGKSIAI